MNRSLLLTNAESAPLDRVPVLDPAAFRDEVVSCVEGGARLSALFGAPGPGGDTPLYAVLAFDAESRLGLLSTRVSGGYPSLTPDCAQAHWFERELAEQCGVTPVGHPWLKPARFPPAAAGMAPQSLFGQPACGDAEYFRIQGEEIHEVAVGPVHAGIIEPGHFRFQCHGETVHHLEISLGYQHRGVERALTGGPTPRTIPYVETLAGDTTVGHALAYAHAVEGLARVAVPARAHAIRGIALELERAANHIGDLGALAGDIGFLPTQSYCGRIRGDVLNMTAVICGNRFGRGLVRPGGVAHDLDAALCDELLGRLTLAEKDAASAIDLLWNTPTVLARFENAGPLTTAQALDVGLVGVAARACGVDQDVRRDFPHGIFQFSYVTVSSWSSGDVFARAFVRWMEIQRSFAFIREQLESLMPGPIAEKAGPLAPGRIAVALTEGWRGEICHVAMTGPDGRFSRYKVVDPSFHNWFGLALALRGQPISDFPLCNKSFNLSYCGHDL